MKSENLAMAEAIFRGISGYDFMHSSFYVKDAVIKAAEKGLPGLGEYLDGRMRNVKHMFDQTTQHHIKPDKN